MAQVDTSMKHNLFLHEQLIHLHTENTDEASTKAFDEDIMENNYMFVMSWNLSYISYWIFPQYCFSFLQPNLKIIKRLCRLLRELPSKKKFFCNFFILNF